MNQRHLHVFLLLTPVLYGQVLVNSNTDKKGHQRWLSSAKKSMQGTPQDRTFFLLSFYPPLPLFIAIISFIFNIISEIKAVILLYVTYVLCIFTIYFNDNLEFLFFNEQNLQWKVKFHECQRNLSNATHLLHLMHFINPLIEKHFHPDRINICEKKISMPHRNERVKTLMDFSLILKLIQSHFHFSKCIQIAKYIYEQVIVIKL